MCPREIGRLNAGYHNHLTRTSSRSTLAQGMQSDISWPSMKLAGCGQWDMYEDQDCDGIREEGGTPRGFGSQTQLRGKAGLEAFVGFKE